MEREKHWQEVYGGKQATQVSWACTACLLLMVGCHAIAAQDAPLKTGPPADFTQTLRHQGVERSYHIHLPPGFRNDKRASLVLGLHGGGGSGLQFDQGSTRGSLAAAADRRGMVVVFPDGINKHWCDGRTEARKGKKPCDDVGFISKIIDIMLKNYGLDPARVYVTGMSNGGFMSLRLAMDLSEKFAAVAPVAAQMAKVLEGKQPRRPVSVMIIHGTKDPIVPFGAGHVRLFRFGRSRGEVLSTAATIEYFRRYDGCGERPKKIRLEDNDPSDGTHVEFEQYLGCKEGTEVSLVKVIGGGHTWPGVPQYLKPWLVGTASRDFNASEMILDFFLRHSRRGRS